MVSARLYARQRPDPFLYGTPSLFFLHVSEWWVGGWVSNQHKRASDKRSDGARKEQLSEHQNSEDIERGMHTIFFDQQITTTTSGNIKIFSIFIRRF